MVQKTTHRKAWSCLTLKPLDLTSSLQGMQVNNLNETLKKNSNLWKSKTFKPLAGTTAMIRAQGSSDHAQWSAESRGITSSDWPLALKTLGSGRWGNWGTTNTDRVLDYLIELKELIFSWVLCLQLFGLIHTNTKRIWQNINYCVYW